ncbi:MAG: GerW family sporulation protein [Oscillospiraceae bacterium]|nr:GerW family sporulation protein [Oscillospiraceae bacterium]
MAQHLEGLMSTSMEKIRQLVDVNTIIGEAITAPNGTTIIPISKVSFGFVSGGSDVPSKSAPQQIFAGGAGAGVTIKPMTFLVIKPDGDIQVLDAIQREGNLMESLFEAAPELIEKVKAVLGKMKPSDKNANEKPDSPPDKSNKK